VSSDLIHPNDTGYRVMAAAMLQALGVELTD
jgi:lysophospholipase L1-like esterase